jgi:NADH-quinone oxidoreductase subunit L
MVTAGIFMVARMSPLFEMSEAASTLSQLGYMTVALGASAYSVAVFHLMTHAFFKALLFLAAGSVIMRVHHNQDIRWMGGLRKYMPLTWITALLGSLALIGTPLFSGFYSKDSIIETVHFSNLPASGFAYFALLAGVFVTAFYSFRMYFLVFHGKERFDQNPDAHHDDDHGHGGKPHESPWVVTVPLMLLAIPSVLIGYYTIEPMLFGDFFKGAITVNAQAHPAMTEFAKIFHGPMAMASHAFSTPPFWLALAGVVTAWYFYLINPAVPAAIGRALRPLVVVLENKYYMDWFNEHVLARGARGLGLGLWKGGDQAVIDGAVVNGSWRLVAWVSSVVRQLQSGFIYHYALAMIIGIFLLMTWFVWLNK